MTETTLRVDRELHTAIKIEAAKQQRSLLEVTEEALEEWLRKQLRKGANRDEVES